MTIISYAQNFEDVMLWRALKDIENGFYIDIGANDPTVDSVSRAFYEKGWRGIHVEPSPEFTERLRIERPDEIVEQVAVGNESSSIAFYQIEGTGLSTADAAVAKKHENSGFLINEINVSSVPLDDILNKYSEHDVHWLKIDVEGFEKEVLESWDKSEVRPWIILIESTKPLSTEESYECWEKLLLDKDYIFAYFDGLNRFYIHEAKSELVKYFSKPPNIFDGFVLSGQASNGMCSSVLEICQKEKVAKEQAEAKAKQAEAKAKQAEAKAEQAEVKAKQAEAKAEQAEAKAKQAEVKAEQAEAKAKQAEIKADQSFVELQAVIGSKSWRLTAPLRWCNAQTGLLKHHGTKVRVKAAVKKILKKLVNFVNARPKFKQFLITSARRLGLINRLKKLYWVAGSYSRNPFDGQKRRHYESLDTLSPRASKIFHDLKSTTEKKKEHQ